MARTLALRLTDALASGIISTTDNAGENPRHAGMVAVGDGAGEKLFCFVLLLT